MTITPDDPNITPDAAIEKISFAHDKFFKKSLAHVDIAKDFFQHNLPAKVLADIDLNTLTLEPTFLSIRGFAL